MIRCFMRTFFAASGLALALLSAAPAALAQPVSPLVGQRTFPNQVQYGRLQITEMPTVQLNGKNLRTAPGFRLFSPDNKLIFAHTVQGQNLQVAYVIEASTQWLLTAWILTPQEASTLTKR